MPYLKIHCLAFVLILISHLSIIAQDRNAINPDIIERHMNFLASDVFEGRGTGTTGGNLAAKYIAQEFSEYGLKAIADGNTYYQYVPMHGSYPLDSSKLTLYNEKDTLQLNLKEDYLLYKTGQQTFVPSPTPLVFVGYGIIAPEFDYNDYLDTDVEGKIVVFFDGEPLSEDEEYFNGDIPTIYSYPESKQRIAASRGAAGSIMISSNSALRWDELIVEFSFEDVTLAYSASSYLSILLNSEVCYHLFENSEHSFNDVIEMKESNILKSFPLDSKISFWGEFKQRDFVSPNIVGLVEGSDDELKDSYIIVSAHYDHLGIGIPVNGDSIYNGAMDNAIGVSVLLELSRLFSKLEQTPERSIIFLSVTGEEKGLLGSTYYTDHPIVPLHKTIANINIDGVAFFKDFSSIVAIGSEYSTLDKFVDSTAYDHGLTVENIPDQFSQYEAFNRSDQITFALAGIPSLLILEGLKNKTKTETEVLKSFIDYMDNKYHTPFDDLNQQIDYEAAVNFTNILFDVIFKLASSETTPEWKEGAPYIHARLRTIAEDK